MNHNIIFARVYVRSNLVILGTLLSLCYFFNWPKELMLATAVISLVVSSPGVLIVHAIACLLRKWTISTGFAWIMLLAALPLAVSIPAFVFEEFLPGNTVFLIVLGMLTAYLTVFSLATAISKLFHSINNHE